MLYFDFVISKIYHLCKEWLTNTLSEGAKVIYIVKSHRDDLFLKKVILLYSIAFLSSQQFKKGYTEYFVISPTDWYTRKLKKTTTKKTALLNKNLGCFILCCFNELIYFFTQYVIPHFL